MRAACPVLASKSKLSQSLYFYTPEPAVGGDWPMPEMPSRHLYCCPCEKYLFSGTNLFSKYIFLSHNLLASFLAKLNSSYLFALILIPDFHCKADKKNSQQYPCHLNIVLS